MDNKQIFEMADELKAAKEHKKDLEAEKFTRNGSTFYLNSRLYASPRAEMKEAMFAALIDHGYGDLITQTVNANTLSSFCKEQREANKDVIPDWLAEVVNIHDKITVGIRKG